MKPLTPAMWKALARERRLGGRPIRYMSGTQCGLVDRGLLARTRRSGPVGLLRDPTRWVTPGFYIELTERGRSLAVLG